MSHRNAKPGWRPSSAFAAILLLLAASCAYVANGTGGPMFSTVADATPSVGPVLMLSLSPASVEIRPAEGNTDLQFTGVAEVQQPIVLRSIVTLSASCYWPAIVSPSTLEFQGAFKQSFSVTVVVPSGALPKQRQILEVVGTCKAPAMPVDTANATAAIYIVDYPLLVVQYDVTETQFKAGKTHDIKLMVESKASEDLELHITSSGDPGAIKAELKGGTQTIPAQDRVNVTVRVSVPKSAEGGAQVLNLRLTATTGDGSYEYKMMLNIPCDVDANITSAFNKRGVLYMVVFVIVVLIAAFYLLKGSWWGGKRFRRWRAARKAARRAAREAGSG